MRWGSAVVTIGQMSAFGVVALIIIAIPGPSVLFVIGRALAYGRRTAIASVVGNSVGVYVVAAAVALGVGTVVERSEIVFMVVKLAGACYLIWLGWQALRHRRDLAEAFTAGAAPRGSWRALREGFLVGVANPKVVILFAAVLPQFVNRSAGDVPVQMLLLSLMPFVISLVSDSAWGVAASAVRSWFARSPRRLSLVGGTGGLAMIGLGFTLAFTGRRD